MIARYLRIYAQLSRVEFDLPCLIECGFTVVLICGSIEREVCDITAIRHAATLNIAIDTTIKLHDANSKHNDNNKRNK